MSFVDDVRRLLLLRPTKGESFAPPVGWGSAFIGIAILVVLYGLSLAYVFSAAPAEAMAGIGYVLMMIVVSIAAPFAVLALVGYFSGKAGAIAGAVLYLTIYMVVLHVIRFVLGLFDISIGSAELGVLAAGSFLAARGLYGLSTMRSILVGFAAGIVILAGGVLVQLLTGA